MTAMTRISTLTVVALSLLVTSTAEAGPLLDWLRTKQTALTTPATPPTVAYYPGATAVPGAPQQATGLPAPGTCQVTCPVTTQKLVVNYVPKTTYRSSWVRVPVTSYRPTTTTDPTTGCQSTCVSPCVTYHWQLQRIPRTTYKPVYSKVASTNYAPAPVAASCGVCSVQPQVAIPAQAYGVQGAATYVQPAANYQNVNVPAIATPGATPGQPYYGQPAGTADTVPTLQPQQANGLLNQTQAQHPVVPYPYNYNYAPNSNMPAVPPIGTINSNGIIQPGQVQPAQSVLKPNTSEGTTVPVQKPPVVPVEPEGNFNSPNNTNEQRKHDEPNGANEVNPITDPNSESRMQNYNTAPQLFDSRNKTANLPTHQNWDYSPVRFASHVESNQPSQPVTNQNAKPVPNAFDNSAWQSTAW